MKMSSWFTDMMTDMMANSDTPDQSDLAANARKKFLFDTEFGTDEHAETHAAGETGETAEPEEGYDTPAALEVEPAEVEPEVVQAPTFSEEDLARAREEGRTAGRAEATRDMASALEQRLSDTLDAINTQIANMFDVYAKDKEDHSRDAIAVATVIMRKLFPALNMDKAMAEVEHIIVEAMKRTSGSPTLIVKVPQDMHGQVETKTAELAALRGREGTISVIADKDLLTGDISIEWDGGGMMRDTTVMWREIDSIIERNLGQTLGEATEVTEDTQPQAPDIEATPEQEAQQDPTQEVVKQATVSENEETAVESPLNEEKTDPEPDQPGSESLDPEPEV